MQKQGFQSSQTIPVIQYGNQVPNTGNVLVVMMPNNDPRNCNNNKLYNNHWGSLRDWHYGLCACCTECDACCEALCCLTCQLSRQCNMIKYNMPTIPCCYCFLFTFLNPCLCHLPICCGAMQMRTTIRARYGIDGSTCGDCLHSLCCLQCSIQQMLLEMTCMNEFPGACCYSAAQAPHVQ